MAESVAQQSRISVLIVDDHPLLIEGLARTLRERPEFDVAGSCATVEEALAQLATRSIDVVLLDLELEGPSGLEAIRAAQYHGYGARIVVFSAHSEPRLVHDALSAGARGYLEKTVETSDLCNAIARVMRGETVLGPRVQGTLAEELRTRAGRTGDALSPRQREILRLAAAGHNGPAIARRLHISHGTVKRHLSAVYGKLGVSDRTAAVATALREDLLE
jgi:two-component system nitrate/nitrite response regulator NarL